MKKVLILSTYERSGGAAIAANRLLQALCHNGVEANMMCRRNLSWWKGKPQSWTSIFERGLAWACNGFSMKDLWSTDMALLGQDITNTKEYSEADVIHLHWVCQGFISLSSVERFLRDGKKVVWTMHDAWNAMGAYHLKLQQKDSLLERWTSRRKARLYESRMIQFVTCSQWLRHEVETSHLMKNQHVVDIPNPLDAEMFHPVKHENRRRVLFVAQDVNNKMKGMQYLLEAERMINDGGNTAGQGKENCKKVEIVALGRNIPYISNVRKMAELYASFDAFVLPSLSENLPNTIMEAMACGTPCVGFNVGGIPEMIDHNENGYVAKYKDAQDLARGIEYVLSEENHERLSLASREKVIRCYSEESVAKKYMEIYERVL